MISPGLRKMIHDAMAKRATDIHLCAGSPILYRIGRELVPGSSATLTSEVTRQMAEQLMTPEQMEHFNRRLDLDLMVSDDLGRYRVNVSFNNQNVSLVIRLLPEEARTLDDLHLPEAVKQLAHANKGLILITGSTSQGKTATMSGIIHEINISRRQNIITIEDPIETVHANAMSIVRQREIGRDTEHFHSGLRAALRQDPDVVAIGEMRDYETIKIALTAADTGVLVLSTLHILSIDQLIERLLSYAPAEDASHIRYLLSGALRGVVHQELLPATDGGKRVACEVLVATDAVRNIMRSRDSFRLRNVIHMGMQHGMVSMRQSVEQLRNAGQISPDIAEAVLRNY
jgi:twitching motility protein PilT